jgi:EAL domain-containing protein (putative c-di-GMP-specific phosphodiesterase class I)
MTLAAALLRSGSIRIEFQPIVCITGTQTELYAVEALARGPRGTSAERPDVLFEYARRKGIESELDLICIAEAIAAAATLPKQPRLSINVHGSTLGNVPAFAERLLSIAATNGVAPETLILEIVEHRAPWVMEAFVATLETLRDAGVRIAVDDLGVGASNFRMIVDCRPDHLKIDRYIVKGCSQDPYRAAVIESIVTLSRACKAQPIAEGVEDDADLAVVAAAGIPYVQGWLYAKSMTPHQLSESPFLRMPQPMKGHPTEC